jgi:hypothetical protein
LPPPPLQYHRPRRSNTIAAAAPIPFTLYSQHHGQSPLGSHHAKALSCCCNRREVYRGAEIICERNDEQNRNAAQSSSLQQSIKHAIPSTHPYPHQSTR